MEEQRCSLFKNPNHLANLNHMRLSGKLCDVTIKVNEKDFLAHKNILAANLKYFESMFLNAFQESRQDVITLEGVDETHFEAFISFAYTGEILLSDSNALGLLEIANYLNEDSIEKACVEFLEKCMKMEDSCRGYKLATSIECLSLKTVAKTNIIMNFENCSQSTDYLDLNCDSLQDILSDVGPQFAKSPEIFFDGVMKWIVHDTENRRAYIDALFDLIDITKLNKSYLLKYFCKNFENQIYGDVVKYLMAVYYNKCEEIEHQTEQLMVIGQIGGTLDMQFFDFVEKKWSEPHTIDIDIRQCLGRGLISDDKFYCICRTEHNTVCIKVELTIERKAILTCENVLSSGAMCAFDRFIYLCGGAKNDGSRSNQVLRYDSLTNAFETLAPMKTARSDTSAIFYQGCLYVVGGLDHNRRASNSVERYDTKEWTTLPSMCQARYYHAVAILDGRLYACGGYADILSGSMCSVEVYNPSINSWQLVASMNKARYLLSVVAREGKLLAIGGDSNKTVEVYDPRKDEWQLDQELTSGLQIQYLRGATISSVSN